ncbi:hypothetical protein ILUMI_13283, partial [Ignelater luminosus]
KALGPEHCEQLDKVLSRLGEAGMTVKFSKSKFCQDEIKFLGHIVSTERVKIDPDKIQRIRAWPYNKRELQSFLEMCNFYRRFVERHAEYIQPLTSVLKKHSAWEWDVNHQRAFEIVKEKFVEDLVLDYPDFSRLFILFTNASGSAVGAHLFQKEDNGEMLNLAFVEYVRGKTNVVADFLSRYGCNSDRLGEPITIASVQTLELSSRKLHKLLRYLKKVQLEDRHLAWVINQMETDDRQKQEALRKNVKIHKDILFRRKTMVGRMYL